MHQIQMKFENGEVKPGQGEDVGMWVVYIGREKIGTYESLPEAIETAKAFDGALLN